MSGVEEVQPCSTNMRPVDEREFSRVLAEATATRHAARGRRRRLQAATSAGRCRRAANVSTKGLRGITLYEPTEMVMSARAGTPLAQIEDALAARGQMLAFEPIELGRARRRRGRQGTIAGVFATNLSGARRIRAGAARDHLLGVRGVNGRGEIFKSGGRVMKNVTGYDLCRGLPGSWGTLAVMSEVTFKVAAGAGGHRHADPARPAGRDRRRGAVRGDGDALRGVGRRAPAARRWSPGSGTRACARQGQAVTALRIENFAKSVAYRNGRLKEHLKAYGEIHELDRENSLAFWGELRQLSVLQGSDAPLWRISTAPSAGPKVVAAITAYMECRAFYDWSGGLVWVEVLPTTDAGAADIRRVIATHGGHATLIRAEPQVRAAVEVFQPLEAGLRAALAQAQGSLRSGRHSQSRPHVRQFLRDSRQRAMQTNFTPKQLKNPRIAEVDKILRTLRALRLLHRHLPDLRAARRRARQPARPHLPDEGDVRAAAARRAREVQHHVDRCLSCLSCMTTCPSGVDYMHLVDHARAHIEETGTRGFRERLARALLAAIAALSRPLPPGAAGRALRPAVHRPAAPARASRSWSAMLELAPGGPAARRPTSPAPARPRPRPSAGGA